MENAAAGTSRIMHSAPDGTAFIVGDDDGFRCAAIVGVLLLLVGGGSAVAVDGVVLNHSTGRHRSWTHLCDCCCGCCPTTPLFLQPL